MPRLVLALTLLLAGCGQSGDLYLPPKEQPAPPAEPQPTPEQQQQEKDKK